MSNMNSSLSSSTDDTNSGTTNTMVAAVDTIAVASSRVTDRVAANRTSGSSTSASSSSTSSCHGALKLLLCKISNIEQTKKKNDNGYKQILEQLEVYQRLQQDKTRIMNDNEDDNRPGIDDSGKDDRNNDNENDDDNGNDNEKEKSLIDEGNIEFTKFADMHANNDLKPRDISFGIKRKINNNCNDDNKPNTLNIENTIIDDEGEGQHDDGNRNIGDEVKFANRNKNNKNKQYVKFERNGDKHSIFCQNITDTLGTQLSKCDHEKKITRSNSLHTKTSIDSNHFHKEFSTGRQIMYNLLEQVAKLEKQHLLQPQQVENSSIASTVSTITNPSIFSIPTNDGTKYNVSPSWAVAQATESIPSEEEPVEQALIQLDKDLPKLLSALKGELNPKIWFYQMGLLGRDVDQRHNRLSIGGDEWHKELHRALQTEAIFSGDPRVQNAVGNLHRDGIGAPQDGTKAFEWYQLAANQGYKVAQTNLGRTYNYGRGVSEDYTKAMKWYQLAANQGCDRAQCAMACMYRNGVGVPQDYTMAAGLYQLAANQDDAEALNNLGIMYCEGQGVSQDYGKALELYQLAASQGVAEAQINLGQMYHKGLGVPQDYNKALELYQRAASQGVAGGQINLGTMYRKGQGVSQNYSKALELYQLGANQGVPRAQFCLGGMHYFGLGIPMDYKKAAAYFKLAAQQGYMQAQYNLGCMFCMGQGVSKDFTMATEFYQLAANQGDALAQIALGAIYERGLCQPADHAKAAELFRLAYEKSGIAKAYFSYRRAVNRIEYIKRLQPAIRFDAPENYTTYPGWMDYSSANEYFRLAKLTKAMELYNVAADHGHRHAQFKLGLMYQFGIGTSKDHKTALDWYKRGAIQGDVKSQFNLGVLYEKGKGTSQDVAKAVKWYQQAANQGHNGSQYCLDALHGNKHR